MCCSRLCWHVHTRCCGSWESRKCWASLRCPLCRHKIGDFLVFLPNHVNQHVRVKRVSTFPLLTCGFEPSSLLDLLVPRTKTSHCPFNRDINPEIRFVFCIGLRGWGKIGDHACAEVTRHAVFGELVFNDLP